MAAKTDVGAAVAGVDVQDQGEPGGLGDLQVHKGYKDQWGIGVHKD